MLPSHQENKTSPNSSTIWTFFFFWAKMTVLDNVNRDLNVEIQLPLNFKHLNSSSLQKTVFSPICRLLKNARVLRLWNKGWIEPQNSDRNWAILCSRQENKVTCSAVRLASWYLFCWLSCLHSRMNKWSGSHFCYTASKLLTIVKKEEIHLCRASSAWCLLSKPRAKTSKR